MPKMDKYLLSERTGRKILHEFGVRSAKQNRGLSSDMSFDDYWSGREYCKNPPNHNCRSACHSFMIWDEVKGVSQGDRVFAAFMDARSEQDWRPVFTLSNDNGRLTVDFNADATEYCLFIDRRRFDIASFKKGSSSPFKIAPWESWPGRLGRKVEVNELSDVPYSIDRRPKYRHVCENLANWFRSLWHDRFLMETTFPGFTPFRPAYAAVNRKHGIAFWGESSYGRFEACLAFFDSEIGKTSYIHPRFSVMIMDSVIHIDTAGESQCDVAVYGVDLKK